MNKSILSIFIPFILFGFQIVDNNKMYRGTVKANEQVIATFTVSKFNKNDSTVWSYHHKHDDDYTLSVVKYAAKGKLNTLSWNNTELNLRDTITCQSESLYIFDIYETNSDVFEGYFIVSKNYGLVSIASSKIPEFLEINGAPKFENCIKSYLSNQPLFTRGMK